MHQRVLGPQQRAVSAMGLGCMGMSEFYGPSDDAESLLTLHRALALGITLFDSADTYGHGHNEQLLGQFVRQIGPARRQPLCLASKFGIVRQPGQAGRRIDNRPAYIRQACEASLQRLGVEQIDLYYCHRRDPEVPIEEVVEAMAGLVRAGKVGHLGASNCRAWQLAKLNFTARAHGWAGFETIQAHYNLLYREEERELLPFCIDQGIAVLPWSPLARGRLARPDAPLGSKRAALDDVAESLYGPPGDPVLDALAAQRQQTDPLAYLCQVDLGQIAPVHLQLDHLIEIGQAAAQLVDAPLMITFSRR